MSTDLSSQGGGDEIRTATILFSDVVGSTALGEQLTPDEVKALIGDCVSLMTNVVEQYGGRVGAYMGDGICAYFGVPVAHGDDAQRAARAALHILRVVSDYSKDIEVAWGISDFNIRVGINTGPTAVGFVGGADPQAVAMGDTTNVAARLQSVAGPGTIAIGPATAKLLAHHFVLELVGDLPLKGRDAAVKVWRLVQLKPEAKRDAPVSLVGRSAEVMVLKSLLGDLSQGRGQVVLLVGEHGIGKTRMLCELEIMTGSNVIWLQSQCSSYGDRTPYQPFVDMFKSWLQVETESQVALRTKLRAKLGTLMESTYTELMPFLGRLLSMTLSAEQEDALRALNPEALGRNIRASFVSWVTALARESSVVIAVDDLQWADPFTRQLAEDLLHLTDRTALLIVTAMTPDSATEGWRFRTRAMVDYSHRAIEMKLTPLTLEASEQLVDSLVPALDIDPSLRREVATRAEGNAFYVEELLRAALDDGGLQRSLTWSVAATAGESLPPAIENVLVARMDRLPPEARAVIQAAAVVGREFHVEQVQRVLGQSDLSEQLAVLLRAEIIREVHRYPDLVCAFRHGLLQQAAVSSLTPARMRELCERVAANLEETTDSLLDDNLERLAYYYYRSANQAKALNYLQRAAQRAQSMGASGQALALWSRALKVAERLKDTEAREVIEVELEQANRFRSEI